MSAYERGVKSPTIGVAERILEAAGYELALVTKVRFDRHVSPGVYPFWVPDRLWRGRLPECFVKVHLNDDTRFRGTRRFGLRKRPQRRRMYEMLLRRGHPEELIDWVDGALLVDLWDELTVPHVVRQAWTPVVDAAGDGPIERPWYGLPAIPGDSEAVTESPPGRASQVP